MKIAEHGQQLTISETPGGAWLFGAFFMIVGAAFVFGASGGYSNYFEVPRYGLVFHFVGGSIALAIGLGVIFIAPMTRISIDRSTSKLHLKRRGFMKRINRFYSFDEITDFYVIEGKDSDGGPVWSLSIDFADGTDLKISAFDCHDEKYIRDIAFRANEFMYKKIPSFEDRRALR